MPNRPRKLTRLDRFWAKIKVDPATGCWLWIGHVNKVNGYGQFWDGEKVVGAHTYAFRKFKGPIRTGYEPDHGCRVRRCANPAHLKSVTRRENLLLGDTIAARKASQTHCQNGHPLSGENLYVTTSGTRNCRICRRQNYRHWVKLNRARRRQLDCDHYRRSGGSHAKDRKKEGRRR